MVAVVRKFGVVVAAAALVAAAVTPVRADTGWHEVGLPFFWPKTGINTITAAGAGNVWFAGYQGSLPIFAPELSTIIWTSGNPVVRRWTGSGWKEYPLNGYSGTGEVNDVSAGTETWITSNASSGPYVARFDGTAFARVTAPSDVEQLRTVHTGPAGTWLTAWRRDHAGEGLYRWRDGAFVAETLPAGLSGLTALVQTGPSEAWLGATRQQAGGGSVATTLHWTGGAWTEVPTPTASKVLRTLAAGGPGDIWAAAADLVARWAPVESLLHWNGTAWSPVALPGGGFVPRDVVVDGTGRAWLGGTDGTTGVLYRRDGDTWTKQTIPLPSGAKRLDLYRFAAIPGTTTLWAEGTRDDTPVVMTTG
ncbi:hypothetical protein BTM25_16500 [Actinomadura rubteroloni]|uniref:Uncharacterized protein n=1 Tax=Actinomadura rubteroloni TaxID=1926885 RepID=A0A2P4UQD6_9ACTN|nr:hypothetical protein BTM25_16500 [Actinomadura rubteroloni]